MVMIKIKLKDYEKYLLIVNLVDVKISNVNHTIKRLKADLSGIEVQAFDSNKIAGWEHLYFAALNALKAFQSGYNISKSLSMELLLYASAERQIKNAIQKVGINENTKEVTIAILANEKNTHKDLVEKLLSILNGKIDKEFLEKWTNNKVQVLKNTFNISDLELSTLKRKNIGVQEIIKRLIIERMAILATKA